MTTENFEHEWENESKSDIEWDITKTWAEITLQDGTGLTLDDLDLKENLKERLRKEGYK